MYTALIVLLVGLGVLLTARGGTRRRPVWIAAGVLLIVATVVSFASMSLWGEHLWFAELGYAGRFWISMLARIASMLAGALVAGLIVFMLTVFQPSRRFGLVPALVGAAIGALWGLSSWEVILRFLYSVPTHDVEPIRGRTTGFYLFALPFYHAVYGLLVVLAVLGIAAALGALFAGEHRRTRGAVVEMGGRAHVDVDEPQEPGEPRGAAELRSLFVSAGALALILAWGRYLATFRLLQSQWGATFGAGWTDVHVRLPAYFFVAALLLLLGIAFLLPPTAARLARWLGGPAGVTAPAAIVGATWFAALVALPLLFQWLRVVPNELTRERPYIANTILFTRKGFQLDKVEETEYPVLGEFTSAVVERNRGLLGEVRLWDTGALDAVFRQFQAIRHYYEMPEVDIDRYTLGGRYRQVMLTPREIDTSNLPPEYRTFTNEHFKYTHGYGAAMAPVSDFTPDGLPVMLLRDIPPVAAYPEIAVTRPEIYYGERTSRWVVVNSREPDLDYPSGEQNVYSRYQGTGGILLDSALRKLMFSWKVDSVKLLLSDYPTRESRIMLRREIRERVKTVAPFLTLDRDPYLVVTGGRLSWILDAYTTSRHYPYSEPFQAEEQRTRGAGVVAELSGKNYVRNAVKAVVDAYDGSVTLYVFDPDDPIIQVYDRIYPGLLRQRAAMPAELFAHVRYPEGYLLAQGLVWAKYHMSDPEVFYNQEDLWVRATEKYYDDVQPVEPYYVMWKPPGAERPELALIQPFTPHNRQVLIGWIAGMSDGDNYGRLLSYHFPKDKRVLGTQQLDTKIDQDPVLAARLALWSQRARVIRGNALVIPIDGTLLYVEPIFLQAKDAAYPELRVVVVMHGDRMSYASTFQEALSGLVSGMPPRLPGLPGGPSPGEPRAVESGARRANDAFDAYLRALGEQRFEDAAREIEALQRALRGLLQPEDARGAD